MLRWEPRVVRRWDDQGLLGEEEVGEVDEVCKKRVRREIWAT